MSNIPEDTFLRDVAHLSHLMTKPTKWHVHPAKTQISLGIRPVWSEPLLCAQWVAKDPSFHHVVSKDWSDWADAQADLSLCWAHMLFCWFCHEAAHFTSNCWNSRSSNSFLWFSSSSLFRWYFTSNSCSSSRGHDSNICSRLQFSVSSSSSRSRSLSITASSWKHRAKHDSLFSNKEKLGIYRLCVYFFINVWNNTMQKFHFNLTTARTITYSI